MAIFEMTRKAWGFCQRQICNLLYFSALGAERFYKNILEFKPLAFTEITQTYILYIYSFKSF